MIGDLLERKDRPAYVRFEKVPVEDMEASKREGHYVAKDVDFALITPPYSKDVFKIKVEQWKVNMKQDVQNERMPSAWMESYLKAYATWQNGQEMPLNGTPIKGWGVISPAQQETLIRMTILTVEDLANVNDEGIKRIGMGALDLKNKAVAWLQQLNDKGPLTQEIAALKRENMHLNSSLETLTRQVTELTALARMNQTPDHVQESEEISVSDIIEEPTGTLVERYKSKFGKPPHHRMKPETIEAALKG